MKDIILVVVLLVMVSLLVLVVYLGGKANKATKSLEEERYSRMVAEETLQKNAAKMTTLSSQLKDDQDKMAKIEDILDQEKGVNTDLKKQYDALAQAKTDLEAKLLLALQEKAKLAAQVKAQQPQPAAAKAPAGH